MEKQVFILPSQANEIKQGSKFVERIKRKIYWVYFVAFLAIPFYSSPSAAFEYCVQDTIKASICTLPLPEDRQIVLPTRNVDITTAVNFNIKSSLKDTKRCNEAKGRLGKLRTGELLCITEMKKTNQVEPQGIAIKEEGVN